MHDNITYVIVPFVDVTQAMIDVACENSFETLRHSVDGVDRVILKWVGSTPALLSGYTPYDHDEILVAINNAEWNLDEDGGIESSSSSGA
jgi:hypothetical protein